MLEYWSNRWCGVRVWPHAPGCCGAEGGLACDLSSVGCVYVRDSYWYVLLLNDENESTDTVQGKDSHRDDEWNGPSLARCVVIVVSR